MLKGCGGSAWPILSPSTRVLVPVLAQALGFRLMNTSIVTASRSYLLSMPLGAETKYILRPG